MVSIDTKKLHKFYPKLCKSEINLNLSKGDEHEYLFLQFCSFELDASCNPTKISS